MLYIIQTNQQVFFNPSEVWRTRTGQQFYFFEMSHQHWSNIYWYYSMIVNKHIEYKIHSIRNTHMRNMMIALKCHGMNIDDATNHLSLAKEQLRIKFENDILDYKPLYNNEKRWYKQWNTRNVLVEKMR